MSTNHIKPVKSLRNFTAGIIDYAGLFPPASLELAQAFHNHIFYMQGEYKWMLGKFIIPAKKLFSLGELLENMTIDDKVSLSVLGSGGNSIAELRKNFEEDLELAGNFFSSFGNSVSFDAFEVRLPSEIFRNENNDELLDLMLLISVKIEAVMGKEIPVFFEVNLTENYEQEIIRTVETIASIKKSCGYKLRTGGIEPSAFPKPEVIAFAIMTCCEFNVPMKCTAGLHHPIRHFNNEVNSVMHGFMNVFAAGILAYTSGLDESEIIEVLTDEDPYEFIFNENGFIWNDTEITNSEIISAREKFMLSYGSCSFNEPVDDLKTMELF